MAGSLREMFDEVLSMTRLAREGTIDRMRARALLAELEEKTSTQDSLPIAIAAARLEALSGNVERAHEVASELRQAGSFTDEVSYDIEEFIEQLEHHPVEKKSAGIPGLDDIQRRKKSPEQTGRKKYRSSYVSENIGRLKEKDEQQEETMDDVETPIELPPQNIIPLDPPTEEQGETTIVSETLAAIYDEQGAYSAALKAYIMLAREQGNYARFAKKIEELKVKVASEQKKDSEE